MMSAWRPGSRSPATLFRKTVPVSNLTRECCLIEYTLTRFHEELDRRLTDLRRQTVSTDELHRQRQHLQVKAERVTEAIAETGHSPALLSKLADIEAQVAQVDRRIEAHSPVNLSASVDEIREFVYRNVMELRELLHQDPSRSKAELSQHIGQLVLTPTETPSGPVYEVSDGGMNLLPGKDVMLLVARDGIEPPTPAFSGMSDQ
jgi:hypothetical protein